MKLQLPLSLLIVAASIVTSHSFGGVNRSSSASSDNVQVINVTAKKYEFNPSSIRVKAGARVQLKITATDHAHGFSMKGTADGSNKTGLHFSTPNACQKIEEGQTATVEFVAQLPGTYPFRCCVHCGWHHRSMKGVLIVEP
jgi:heme/copper-type cytochrome/quinol oxidase subunit 2